MTPTTSTFGALRPLTSATFDEVVASSDLPVVVDVWAAWCGPCGPMSEVLDQVAAENTDRLVAFTVDADAETSIARRFDVMSLPTLLVFVDGELVLRTVGARGKGRLLEDLAPYLG